MTFAALLAACCVQLTAAYVLDPAVRLPFDGDCAATQAVSKCALGLWDAARNTCGCSGRTVDKTECRQTCGGCDLADIECAPDPRPAPVCRCKGNPVGCTQPAAPVIDVAHTVVGPVLAKVTSADLFASTLRATTHPCGNLNHNLSCPLAGSSLAFLHCTDLRETDVGSSPAISVPVTTNGNYSLATRTVAALSWSAFYQPSFAAKTVTLIPVPTVTNVTGSGRCVLQASGLVLHLCAHGTELVLSGYDFPPSLNVVFSPIAVSPAPTAVRPWNQLTLAAGGSVALTGASQDGGGAAPACAVDSVSGGFYGTVRCTLSVPQGCVGLWTLRLVPTVLPFGVPPPSDLLQRGLLDSNTLFLDTSASPFSAMVQYTMQSCQKDLGHVLVGCGGGTLRLEGVRQNDTVAVAVWPVLEPQLQPRFTSATLLEVFVPWNSTQSPAGLRLHPCTNLTEVEDAVASCSLDLPLGVQGWAALQVFVNGNAATAVPKAVLPRPRLASLSGCASSNCPNGTRVTLQGQSLATPAGVAGDPEVRFAAKDPTQAGAPPVCADAVFRTDSIECTVVAAEGSSGIFSVEVWVPIPSGFLRSQEDVELRVRGVVPVVTAAYLDTCQTPEALQHCTDGVLNVSSPQLQGYAADSARVVFASPLAGPLPTCAQTRETPDRTGLLCDVVFPDNGPGIYTVALQHASDFSEPWRHNLRGRGAGRVAQTGAFAFDPAPVDGRVWDSSVSVGISHSFRVGDGYSARLVHSVVPAAAADNLGRTLAYADYDATFLQRERVLLTPLSGEALTAGTVRVQLFYAQAPASAPQVARYTMGQVVSVETPLPDGEQGNGSSGGERFVIPEKCLVEDWGEWSTCSAPCNTGTMRRNRSVIGAVLPPWYDAEESLGCPPLREETPCNTHACLCAPGERGGCSGAGTCSDEGLCNCRKGLRGATCDVLESEWRAGFLRVFVILLIVAAGLHSLASEHSIGILIVVTEVQLLTGYFRTTCGPVDMRQAAEGMEWVLVLPSPSVFGGDVGSLLWTVAVFAALALAHAAAALLLARSRVAAAAKAQQAEGKVETEGEREDREDEEEEEEGGGSEEDPNDPVAIRRKAFAALLFPSATIFLWLLFLVPVCYVGVRVASRRGEPSEVFLGVVAVALFGAAPIVGILVFFKRHFAVEFMSHHHDRTLQDLQEEGRMVRYTNHVHCVEGFYSEAIYARCVVSGSLDADAALNQKRRNGLFLAPVPAHFWSSKHTTDSLFKKRWGVLLTAHRSACPYFTAYHAARNAIVASLLGIAPAAGRSSRQCPPVFAAAIFVHLLFLAAMVYERPWCSSFLAYMMSLAIAHHVLLGGLLIALSAVGDTAVSNMSDVIQYVVIAALSCLLAMTIWGIAVWVLTRLNHKRSIKEAGALRSYYEARRAHGAAGSESDGDGGGATSAAGGSDANDNDGVASGASGAGNHPGARVRSVTPPNPLLELEMMGARRNGDASGRSVRNQKVVYTTLQGEKVVSPLKPHTTVRQLDWVQTLEETEVRQRAEDEAGKRAFVLDVSGLQGEAALPPLGAHVRVKMSAGDRHKRFYLRQGTVVEYDLSQPTAAAVVEFEKPHARRAIAVQHLSWLEIDEPGGDE